jgi:hypothetical protein
VESEGKRDVEGEGLNGPPRRKMGVVRGTKGVGRMRGSSRHDRHEKGGEKEQKGRVQVDIYERLEDDG